MFYSYLRLIVFIQLVINRKASMSRKTVPQLKSPAGDKQPIKGQNALQTYRAFVWDNKPNRQLLLASVLISLLLFYLLTLAYPIPDIFADGHSYIYAAALKQEVYYRPYGYSKFLSILHDFSQSANFVVWVQHLLFILAGIFLLTSIDYLIGFKHKYIKWIGWILVTINPLGLFIDLTVASDSVFTSITILWMTTLLWIFVRPSWYWIILSILLLYWAFNVRYNALYYPFLFAIAILLTPRLKTLYKSGAILLALMVILGAYKSTKNKVELATGAQVFAGFEGWQMANNTLYYFKKVDFKVDPAEEPDIRMLDTLVRYLVDSFPSNLTDGSSIGPYYMWDKKSPLKRFLNYYQQKYKLKSYYTTWYHVSKLYSDYARIIIAADPRAYFKYYILTNARCYFLPDLESLLDFEATKETYPDLTRSWYKIRQEKPILLGHDYKKTFMAPYTIFNAVLLIISLVIPLLFLLAKRKTLLKKEGVEASAPIILWLLYYFANAAFSIIASVVVIRYQAPFILLAICFTLITLDKYLTHQQSLKRNYGK